MSCEFQVMSEELQTHNSKRSSTKLVEPSPNTTITVDIIGAPLPNRLLYSLLRLGFELLSRRQEAAV